jgi:D-glycero-alpha-D-manno-heptose-7-phosphate kinase
VIITRTPLRVSLFGGGTDTPAYYNQSPRGGAVLGFAIDHYVYLTVRELPAFHEHNVRLVYSRIELTEHADDLVHPAARAVLTQLGRPTNIECTYSADLPSRAGLGSSSSFICGLITAIDALSGRHDHPGLLARRAIHLERTIMGEPGGFQDQIYASYGDLLRIDFGGDGHGWEVRRPMVPQARQRELLDHLLLAFTGEVRDAPQIASSLDLSPTSPYLARMRTQVDEAKQILLSPTTSIEHVGELLDEAWRLKQALSPLVATPAVTSLYERARAAGAIGGKLLGAGGGGFLLLFARPEDHKRVRTALPGAVFVPVGIARNGSTVVVNGWAT